MSTYKVIQDIEAEDHIIGPLSLRQFIYGLIAVFFLYLCFISISRHAIFLLVIFLPPALFTGFFAFPFGKDQPTEVWALAKLRYFFKPRRRIWDQSGIKELVTVTVPKKLEVQRTNGLNQTEVKSRLEALASTIDSRGWAIKNATDGGYVQATFLPNEDSSDRLVNLSSMPQPVPDYPVVASDDILDEQASPVAQQFTQMIDSSTKNHRQQLMDELNEVRATNNQQGPAWFAGTPLGAGSGSVPQAFEGATTMSGELTAEEAAVLAKSQQWSAQASQANAHLQTLHPQGSGLDGTQLILDSTSDAVPVTLQPTNNNLPTTETPASPPAADPAILKLANNNDLNVATLAREAGKVRELDGSGGEVVIALH